MPELFARPDNTFKKNAPKDLRSHLVVFPQFNQAQLDAMAGLMAPFGPEKSMRVYQTWTNTGGTHTYVVLPNGDEYHLSRDGKAMKLGLFDAPSIPRVPPERTGPARSHKECPERGGVCQYPETCEGPTVITCWARHSRLASEPEGRTTGLHRDSMG
jgi:hypothetical protein